LASLKNISFLAIRKWSRVTSGSMPAIRAKPSLASASGHNAWRGNGIRRCRRPVTSSTNASRCRSVRFSLPRM